MRCPSPSTSDGETFTQLFGKRSQPDTVDTNGQTAKKSSRTTPSPAHHGTRIQAIPHPTGQNGPPPRSPTRASAPNPPAGTTSGAEPPRTAALLHEPGPTDSSGLHLPISAQPARPRERPAGSGGDGVFDRPQARLTELSPSRARIGTAVLPPLTRQARAAGDPGAGARVHVGPAVAARDSWSRRTTVRRRPLFPRGREQGEPEPLGCGSAWHESTTSAFRWADHQVSSVAASDHHTAVAAGPAKQVSTAPTRR